MKQLVITVIIFAVVGFLFFGDDDADGPGASLSADEDAEVVLDPKQLARAMDAECESMLKEPNHAEARAWCDPKNTNHVGFEVSKAEMLKMTNDLYAAGAQKVYITDIMEFGGRMTSACMVVHLPTDPAKRKKVFTTETEIMAQEGGEGSEDVGQKYLMLTLD